MFTEQQLEVVRFCAIECRLQGSGEVSVWWMLRAWEYACEWQSRGRPTVADVQRLGAMVEPDLNANGFREVGVRVGGDRKPDWRIVPDQVKALVYGADALDPAEWFREYEEIHPFRDGNGRTGQILYNWLNGSLEQPEWAPDFWGDPRRVAGAGA